MEKVERDERRVSVMNVDRPAARVVSSRPGDVGVRHRGGPGSLRYGCVGISAAQHTHQFRLLSADVADKLRIVPGRQVTQFFSSEAQEDQCSDQEHAAQKQGEYGAESGCCHHVPPFSLRT